MKITSVIYKHTIAFNYVIFCIVQRQINYYAILLCLGHDFYRGCNNWWLNSSNINSLY